MTEIAFLAEFEVEPRDLHRFLAAVRRELQAVLANEPTCCVFKAALLSEAKGRGVFVEIFENEVTATEHRGLSHFILFHEEIAELDARWSSWCDVWIAGMEDTDGRFRHPPSRPGHDWLGVPFGPCTVRGIAVERIHAPSFSSIVLLKLFWTLFTTNVEAPPPLGLMESRFNSMP